MNFHFALQKIITAVYGQYLWHKYDVMSKDKKSKPAFAEEWYTSVSSNIIVRGVIRSDFWFPLVVIQGILTVPSE